MDSIIRFENVSYIYSKGTPFEHKAIDNVSFDIKRGLVTGIIGHTGSGKSTLAQMMNGLIKNSSGNIYFEDNNIWGDRKKKKDYSLRYRVGLVFQYPEYQLFDETVEKDISFGPKHLNLSNEEIQTRVTESMAFVGLDDSIRNVSPFDLSGGQKRRVAIAGIIAMKPDVLILDEPASGLDPKGKKDIFDHIIDYKEKTNSTIIIISHSMEDMALLCDELIVLNHSHICMQGSVNEVFSHSEELVNIGLTVPQSTKVLMELKKLGYDVNPSFYTPNDVASEIIRLLKGGKNG